MIHAATTVITNEEERYNFNHMNCPNMLKWESIRESMIFALLLCALAPILTVKGVNEPINNNSHDSTARRVNFVIFDKSSDASDELASMDTFTPQQQVAEVASDFDFGRRHRTVNNKHISRLRGSRFLVFDTLSDSDITSEPPVRDEDAEHNEENAYYDFGRFVLEQQRFDNNARFVQKNSNHSRSSKRAGTDKRLQTSRRTSKRKVKPKSNLDVDIEYLESLLLLKQKKKEVHAQNRKTREIDQKRKPDEANDSEAVADEALERFLESSNDQSYVYTNVPSPSSIANSAKPTAISDEPTLCEKTSWYFIHLNVQSSCLMH